MLKYFKPNNYAAGALSLANRYVLGYIEASLAPNPDLPLRHPPIFILGPPRCGSTLLTQVLTEALDVGYLSNLHCQWHAAPGIAETLFRPTARRPKSDFQSAHGTTAGDHAPAECGQWWYRFFRRQPPYMRLDEVDPVKMLRFRQSVAYLTNAFDRPIVFKNNYASLRVQAIAHYLPESLFIVAHREEVDNGHSLLETRLTVHKDYGKWWSMEPPEVEYLKTLLPHQQVIEQIRHIHKTVDADLAKAGVPSGRRIDIQYEDFCDNPPAAVTAIIEFIKSNGCVVTQRGDIPKSFKRRTAIRIDKAVFNAMVDYAGWN